MELIIRKGINNTTKRKTLSRQSKTTDDNIAEKDMNERKRIILLIFIMVATAFIVAGITISMLYSAAFEEEQTRLTETAQSQAHLIEAVAQFDSVYSKDYPGGAAAATISQLIDAHTKYEHAGKTTEFTVGRLDGDQINFLFSHKHDADVESLKPVRFDSKLAEPMRLALSGRSGTVVGLDYRGEVVLAAFEPVEVLNLGIVAKIDLSEIRAPFVKAGLIAGFITALVVMVGASLFIRISKPLVKHLEERAAELQKINTEMKSEISERKQAEEALVVSTARLQHLLTTSPAVIYSCKPSGDYGATFISKNVKNQVGYEPNEFTDDSEFWSKHIHPEDAPRIFEGLSSLFEQGNHIHEYRFRHKDGTYRWMYDETRLVRDAKGNSLEIVGCWIDITGQKQAEGSLRESEDKYRQLFENDSDAVMIFDAETHRFEDANRSALHLYGYSKKEFLSLKAEDISAEKNKTKIALQKIKDRVPGSKLLPSRLHKKKDGTIFPVEITNGIFNSNGRQKIIGAVRDISERKRLETRLHQSNKLEAIGTLAGGIAHDFNNILTAVIGFTELALNNAEKETSLHTHLQQVMTAGNRAKDLVRQIFTFIRQSEQDLKPVQLKFIAKEALKLLRASLPATVEIRQNIQSDSVVMADPTQINQVLMNLYTNAGHAMQEKGGILDVKLVHLKVNSDYAARYPDLNPGFYIKLSVSDTGIGMPPHVLSRIFDPFFTTKDKNIGTGMGLSVVHGIVKSHDGTINVNSELGKGTTFCIFLPAIEGISNADAEGEKPVPEGSETVLLVDDEQMIVDTGKQMLESLGYHVVTKTDSMEALELFKEKPDKFDIVITDMTMPKMTGRELAEKLIQIRSDIPIILTTGYSTAIDEDKASASGILGIVFKPILIHDIALTIRRVLDKTNKRP